jgi:hypothetical protein
MITKTVSINFKSQVTFHFIFLFSFSDLTIARNEFENEIGSLLSIFEYYEERIQVLFLNLLL